jgi:starch phosphorylase
MRGYALRCEERVCRARDGYLRQHLPSHGSPEETAYCIPVIPGFDERDAAGLPRAWLTRIRRSMAELTRNIAARERCGLCGDGVSAGDPDGARAPRQWRENAGAWQDRLQRGWSTLRIGALDVRKDRYTFVYTVPVDLGTPGAEDVLIEVYAVQIATGDVLLSVPRSATTGAQGTYLYFGSVPDSRPVEHYTVRAQPSHPDVVVPAERR